MNKNLIKITLLFLLIGIVSCSKNEPPTPVDERTDKGHEEATKIVLTFTSEQNLTHKQIFNFELDEVSKNIVRKNSKGEILQNDQEPLLLLKGQKYFLDITYYNLKGVVMNNEFLSEEQRPIHQHFFVVNSYKNANNEVITDSTGIWNYTYLDEGNDPIGLRGVFLPSISYAKFDLRVRLLHVMRGNKYIGNNKANGTLPFNAPSDDLLTRSATDFDQKIPVIIN